MLERAESAINAEIRDGGCGYEAVLAICVERDGQIIECKVYRPTDLGWHPLPHLLECWWELRTESGEPMGRFAYIGVSKVSDIAKDCLNELRAHWLAAGGDGGTQPKLWVTYPLGVPWPISFG